jgi:L-glyceraldehyde 3-phosphate reductase
MKYRRLGRTGFEVSEVGFGCGRTGGILLNGTMEERRAAMRKALDGGINWFDTAEAYGSEPALGELLKEVEETPYVSTKVTLDPGAPDLAGQVEEHLDGCLGRLQRGSVDLAQLHNRIDPTAGKDSRAVTVEQVLGPGGIAEGLEKVRADGRCRAIGFTALGDVPAILQVVESGRFDSTQIFYNMINPSAARPMPGAWTGQNLFGLIDACKAHDMGIIGIRVLVGGIIAADMTDRRVSMMTKETDKETEMVKGGAILDELGGGLGTGAQLGLRFALTCADMSLALVGIGSPEHVDAALAASEMGPLPDNALAKLEALYETDFGRV